MGQQATKPCRNNRKQWKGGKSLTFALDEHVHVSSSRLKENSFATWSMHHSGRFQVEHTMMQHFSRPKQRVWTCRKEYRVFYQLYYCTIVPGVSGFKVLIRVEHSYWKYLIFPIWLSPVGTPSEKCIPLRRGQKKKQEADMAKSGEFASKR